MVRDLEDVHPAQAPGQHDRVHALLDVTGQQEPTPADLAEQHDGDVVDTRPRIRRLGRDRAAVRPEDAHRDVVHGKAVAGRETESDRRPRPGEPGGPRRIAWPGAAHAGLEHAPDPVAIEEEGKTRDVILVRVGQDHCIDPSVPRRQVAIEHHQQALGIGAAIDEQAPAPAPLHQDRVTLAHVEDRDPGTGRWPDDDDSTGDRERGDERDRGCALPGRRRPHGPWLPG